MRVSVHSSGLLTVSDRKYDSVVLLGGRVVPMGTIVARKRKNNSTGYTAQIVIKRGGTIVHREARTFDRRAAAATWMEARENVLSAPGGLDKGKDVALSKVIDKYTEETEDDMGRTKAQVLRAIKKYDIAAMKCSEIESHHIVAFANELGKTVQPQTVQNYLSHLSAVFSIAKPAWGYPLNVQAMRDATVVSKRLKITSKSTERDVRPTLAQLDLLMEHYTQRQQQQPSLIPMTKVIAFGLFSTRRQSEITRLLWTDLDEDGSRVLVRDMKNPGEKMGNHVWCDLPAEALAIIRAMPRHGKLIFPFEAGSISASFTRACPLLGIEDLTFHDMRHEGISRLFELGLSIPRVASVSGHRSWASLKRYTHIRQTGDKYANWKWLAAVTA